MNRFCFFNKIFFNIIFLVLYCFLGTKLGYAQNNQISFERITQDQGLSNNAVRDILQDKKGFLWIATEDGINRYDGLNFKTYQYPNTLPSRGVNFLYIDKNDTLWCITLESTILKYVPEKDIFVEPPFSVAIKKDSRQFGVGNMAMDKYGVLWIGSLRGLLKINLNDNSYSLVMSGFRILGITEDDNGTFWLSTPNHLRHFDPKNGNLIALTKPEPSIENGIRGSIYHNGLLYMLADGFYILDTSTEEIIEHYSQDPNNPNSLPSNNLSCFLLSDENTLWIGTYENGVSKFDLKTKTFINYKHNPQDLQSLLGQNISKIFKDRSGVLWIGDMSYGINKVSPYKNLFQLYNHKPCLENSLSNNYIRAIEEDSNGFLWVATQLGGLNRINRKTGEVKRYSQNVKDKNSLASNNVWAVYEDHAKVLWVGSNNGGLQFYNPQKDNFDFFYLKDFPSQFFISVIIEDTKNRLWVGTTIGLCLISADRKTFSILYTSKIPTPNASIQAIFEDSKNNIWVGTENGILCFNSKDELVISQKNPVNPSFENTFITSILEDKDGMLWYTTKGKGLIKFDPLSKQASFVTEFEGLPHNNTYGLLADATGCFWISSDNGICRYDPNTKGFETFGVKDGLQGKEFNRRSFFKNSKEEFFFGGTNGLNSFFPEKIKKNPNPPEVAITEVLATGTFINIPPDNKIELSYTQNLLNLTFVAFDFNAPENNLYSYKLEGVNKDWTLVRGKNQVTYNLYPGTYNFLVKATNNHQVWNDKVTSLQITILSPPWRSNFAYLIYGLLFLGTIFLTFTYQTNKIKSVANLREAQLLVQAAEVQAKATEAQAKIIESENQRHTEELAYARQLQLSLLPKQKLKLKQASIVGQMRTASEVGGDYYDFFQLDSNRYCLAVGDATGHGVAAGLVVGMVKSLLVQVVSNLKSASSISASDLMSSINFALKMALNRRGVGMCLAIAILDIENLTIEISNAGMPYPIFYSKVKVSTQPLEKLKSPPLGFLKRANFPSSTIKLEKGDSIIFFSDGFSERMTNDRKLWSYASVDQELKQICSTQTQAQNIVDELFSACDQFAQNTEANDDMTMLVLVMD